MRLRIAINALDTDRYTGTLLNDDEDLGGASYKPIAVVCRVGLGGTRRFRFLRAPGPAHC